MPRKRPHIEVLQGDITKLDVDAIVNAALVAVSTVLSFMRASDEPRRVVFCTFDADATRVMTRAVAENIDR